jgi:hypothetical protein
VYLVQCGGTLLTKSCKGGQQRTSPVLLLTAIKPVGSRIFPHAIRPVILPASGKKMPGLKPGIHCQTF